MLVATVCDIKYTNLVSPAPGTWQAELRGTAKNLTEGRRQLEQEFWDFFLGGEHNAKSVGVCREALQRDGLGRKGVFTTILLRNITGQGMFASWFTLSY